MSERPPCAWCGKPSTTERNISTGRKLHMVPVCPAHADVVEQRHAEERDRREKVKARKGKVEVWW